MSQNDTFVTSSRTLGKWIKARREVLNYSQKTLADKVKYALPTIQRLEQDRYVPSVDLVEALIRELNISPEDQGAFRNLARPSIIPIDKSSIVSLQPTISSQIEQEISVPELLYSSSANILTNKIQSIHYFIQTIFLGVIAFTLLFLTYSWWLARSVQPLGPLAIQLVGDNNEFVKMVRADGSIVTDKSKITMGEIITATFIVQNTTSQPIMIRAIELSGRGPSIPPLDWNSPIFPSGIDRNIMLQPSETYKYTMQKTFVKTGHYFFEPTLQDVNGKWGGIQPFTRINFEVH
ncbi:MAG: helix-turn-helix transcriptional regulator [Chloroflexota bacterium]|jgi:transcriptional regulator with XRE-family HTH domain